MRQPLLILVTISLLVFSGARSPALAGLQPKFDLQNIGAWSIALGAMSLAGYYMYKNSPRERAKGYREEMGPGEWYLAGYMGVSYLPTVDWKFATGWPPGTAGRMAKNISYEPGVQGGLKFGRFFDKHPWFGIEGETNLSRNNIRGNQGKISPPLPGGLANLFEGPDWFIIWTMQVSFLARYGFLKDKEVPFGRLQPYLGIGPGWEVAYATHDSAKNFAIEAQAGLRYMVTDKIGLFFEYKYSYQFAVEYQNFNLGKQSPESQGRAANLQTMSFDIPHHRFVLGVSYHFKNLYGN